jgi:cytoskeletal protein CcmA (bactofilin family)
MHSRKSYKLHLLLISSLILIFGFGLVGTVQAFESQNDGIIGADEVIDDDVFISAQSVTVDGTVNGILFASGSTVTINGTINGDLFTNAAVVEINGVINGNAALSGQTLTLNGLVEGSLFAVSASLKLSPTAEVGRNLYFAGFSLETEPGSAIGMDIAVASYQALLAGDVKQNISASVSAFEMNGNVGGDITIDVDAPPKGAGFPFSFFPGIPQAAPSGLRISKEAMIGGQLKYTSSAEQSAGIKIMPAGGILFNQKINTQTATSQPNMIVRFGQWLLARLRELVTLLALGGLALWLVPRALNQAVRQVRQTWQATGWGVVGIITGYLVIAISVILILVIGLLLSFVTLGGLSSAVFRIGFSILGLVFAVFTLLVSYGSKLVISSLAGRWIFHRMSPTYKGSTFFPLLVGVLIYVFLRGIPFFGILVSIVVTVIGMGAIFLAIQEWRTSQKAGSLPGASLSVSTVDPLTD